MTDEVINDERSIIRTGRKFEQEYRLDASANGLQVGDFLIALGEQLRAKDELTIVDDE